MQSINFSVDSAKIGETTQHYLRGLFEGLFVGRRFANYCGTVTVAYEQPQVIDYLVLYEQGIYQVFLY